MLEVEENEYFKTVGTVFEKYLVTLHHLML